VFDYPRIDSDREVLAFRAFVPAALNDELPLSWVLPGLDDILRHVRGAGDYRLSCAGQCEYGS